MPPSPRKTAITIVSFKKSLTLCIAHYLNTKQDSGWVVLRTRIEQVVQEWKSCDLTTWLYHYVFGGCCTLYTSIETTNKHRCRHQSSKGKPFAQQHLILT